MSLKEYLKAKLIDIKRNYVNSYLFVYMVDLNEMEKDNKS